MVDPRTRTRADLDRELKPIAKAVWGGKELPFPVLLDNTTQSMKTPIPRNSTLFSATPKNHPFVGTRPAVPKNVSRRFPVHARRIWGNRAEVRLINPSDKQRASATPITDRRLVRQSCPTDYCGLGVLENAANVLTTLIRRIVRKP
jgi:hypothetical protein